MSEFPTEDSQVLWLDVALLIENKIKNLQRQLEIRHKGFDDTQYIRGEIAALRMVLKEARAPFMAATAQKQ